MFRFAPSTRCLPPLLFCACVSQNGKEHFAVGANAGPAFVTLELDRDKITDIRPQPRDAWGEGLMVSYADETDAAVFTARWLYSESDHALQGFAGEARVRELQLLAMFGPAPIGSDLLRVQPLIGVAVGGAWVDFHDTGFVPGLHSISAPSVGFTMALELQVERTVVFGVQGWSMQFGYPGDTYGYSNAAIVYGGIRF